MSGARTCLRSDLPQTPEVFSFISRHMPQAPSPILPLNPLPRQSPGFFCYIGRTVCRKYFPGIFRSKKVTFVFLSVIIFFPKKIGSKKGTTCQKFFFQNFFISKSNPLLRKENPLWKCLFESRHREKIFSGIFLI